MPGKNQYALEFNWQSANPVTTLLPLPTNQNGSVPSGVAGGVMTSTNTIYSNIIDVSRMDNIGLELTWSGTPTGTITILGSSSGVNFYTYTFATALSQPAGSASGQIAPINQFPWKWFMLKYVNASGSGVLTVYAQLKDLN